MKLNNNIYAINLFVNVSISSTLNVEYLMDYKGLDVISLVDESSHLLISLLMSLFSRSPSFHDYQIFYPIQHVKLINS